MRLVQAADRHRAAVLDIVVHSDEAVLAAVYLFTIHFFGNHWRPDKFPLVIFTGSMPLKEFKREFGSNMSA